MRQVRVWMLVLAMAIGLVAVGCSSSVKPTLAVRLEQSDKNLVIQLDTTGFVIGKDGHVHLKLDDGPIAMPVKPTYTIPNVKPGKHTVWVELSDKNHNPIGVQQSADIEFK
jgi:hypothetical protein